MVRIRLNRHEELEADLKRFISALLPHENGDLGSFEVVLNQVTRLIHIEEMEGEFYLIFLVADQLKKILLESRLKSAPTLTRDVLIRILEAQLYDIVSVDGHGFGSMLMANGKRGDNLKDPSTCQAAASLAINRCLELYDEAFEMALTPEAAMSFLPSLRSNYTQAVLKEALSVQGELAYNVFSLTDKKWDPWRKSIGKLRFEGTQGWVDFLGWMSSSLTQRLQESEMEMRLMTSISDANRLMDDVKEREAILTKYGIPPIDMKRPIMKTRYTVLIGKPNLGKTTMAINWLVNVLLEGKKVAVFSEETPESVMLYEYIMPVYVYKKYGFFASYEQIVKEEEVGGIDANEIEERKKMIQMAIADVAESGNYLYIPTLNAWKIYQDLKTIHASFPFDYIVIDHTLSVPGGGEITPRLNAMSSGIKLFKNEFKTSVCLLSHPSPAAKKIVSRAGAQGLTKYSTQIEGDADDVFYMFDTPELEAQGLFGLIHTKGRGASKVLEIVYLTKMFEFKLVIFDPARQKSSGDADEAMDKIIHHEDFNEDGEEEADYDEMF